MRSFLKNTRDLAQRVKNKGILDVVGAGLINKILVLITTVVLIRIMSKDDYGVFSYSYNIINIAIIFSSLGMNSVLIQFSSEQKEIDKRCYIDKYCTTFGLLTNLITTFGLIAYSFFAKEKIVGSNKAIRAFSAIIIFQFLFTCIVSYFRTEFDNKNYRLTTNVNSIIYFVGASIGAYVFSIYGTIIGRYIGFIIAIGYGVFKMGPKLKDVLTSKRYSGFDARALVGYGFTITLTNAVSQILYTVDVLVIGEVVRDSSVVAEYKTATTIPFALAFVPQLIITFIYPYFARNNKNINWIAKHTATIIKYLLLVNAFITIIGLLGAPFIVNTLFTKSYSNTVPCFRVLMVSYLFSGTFRILFGNIIAMLRKVKVNLYLGIAESIINIVLDVIFINLWGSIGAAIATTMITIISSIASGVYLYVLFRRTRKSELI